MLLIGKMTEIYCEMILEILKLQTLELASCSQLKKIDL